MKIVYENKDEFLSYLEDIKKEIEKFEKLQLQEQEIKNNSEIIFENGKQIREINKLIGTLDFYKIHTKLISPDGTELIIH